MLIKANALIITIFIITVPIYIFAQEKTVQDYLDIGVRLSENQETYNEAFTSLQNAASLLQDNDSRFRIVYTKLAKIYNAWGRYEDVIKYCEYVFEIDPNYVEARKYLGIAYYHLEIFNKGIDNLKRWLNDQPMDIEAIEYLGLCYMNLKDYENAMDQFAKINTNRGRESFNSAQQLYLAEYVKPIYNEGINFFDRGDWENAMLKFQQCLVRAPYYSEAEEKLRQSKNNWIVKIKAKLVEDPLNTELRNNLKVLITSKGGAIDFYYDGSYYFDREEWGKAYYSYNNAIMADPNFLDVKQRKNASLNNWIDELEYKLKNDRKGDRRLMYELKNALSRAGRDTSFIVPYYTGLKYFELCEWKYAILNFKKINRDFKYFTEIENKLHIAFNNWINTLENLLSENMNDTVIMSELITAISLMGRPTGYIIPYYAGLFAYYNGDWKNAVLNLEKVPGSYANITKVKEMLAIASNNWIKCLEDSLTENPQDQVLISEFQEALIKSGRENNYVVPYYSGLASYKLGNWENAYVNFSKIPINSKYYDSAKYKMTFSLEKWMELIMKDLYESPEKLDKKELLKDLLRGIGETTKNVDPYYQGIRLLQQKRWLDAVDDLIKVDRSNSRFLVEKLIMEALSNSITADSSRIKSNSSDAFSYMRLARAFAFQYNYDEALTHYERAIHLNKGLITYDNIFPYNESPLLNLNLGIIYYNLGVNSMAIPRFEAIPQNENIGLDAKWYLFLCYVSKDSYSLAKTYFDELIKKKQGLELAEYKSEREKNPNVFYFLGTAFEEVGNIDKAKDYYCRAFALGGYTSKFTDKLKQHVEEGDKNIIDEIAIIVREFEVALDLGDYSSADSSIGEFYTLSSRIMDAKLKAYMESSERIKVGKDRIEERRREMRFSQMLAEADNLIKKGDVISAIAIYQGLMLLEPGNKGLQQKIKETQDRLIANAERERKKAKYYIFMAVMFGVVTGLLSPLYSPVIRSIYGKIRH